MYLYFRLFVVIYILNQFTYLSSYTTVLFQYTALFGIRSKPTKIVSRVWLLSNEFKTRFSKMAKSKTRQFFNNKNGINHDLGLNVSSK